VRRNHSLRRKISIKTPHKGTFLLAPPYSPSLAQYQLCYDAFPQASKFMFGLQTKFLKIMFSLKPPQIGPSILHCCNHDILYTALSNCSFKFSQMLWLTSTVCRLKCAYYKSPVSVQPLWCPQQFCINCQTELHIPHNYIEKISWRVKETKLWQKTRQWNSFGKTF